ncbi:unnamed protein product [Pleuronectes platessa]|uniref:Uncharacterized protein n=1 Tax=Pleuronectes platessa TaxID=8262 RepID=A0A9N7ZDW8_PLEPL|nr:unnamed protein product [Pleuronectes platessa]
MLFMPVREERRAASQHLTLCLSYVSSTSSLHHLHPLRDHKTQVQMDIAHICTSLNALPSTSSSSSASHPHPSLPATVSTTSSYLLYPTSSISRYVLSFPLLPLLPLLPSSPSSPPGVIVCGAGPADRPGQGR